MALTIPLYQRLQNALIRKIESGQWQSGQKLPSEAQLQRHYQMSRVTVRRALSELTAQGYIASKQGQGSFVKARQNQNPSFHYFNVRAAIAELKATPRVELTSFKLIVDGSCIEIRERMNLTMDDYLYQIKYVTFANSIPVFYDTIYLPYLRYPQLFMSELQHTALIPLIRQKYHFEGQFHTTSAPLTIAKPGTTEPIAAMQVETQAYEVVHGNAKVALYSKALSFGKLMRYLQEQRTKSFEQPPVQ